MDESGLEWIIKDVFHTKYFSSEARAGTSSSARASGKNIGAFGDSMFIGEYQHKLDNKGRINVPAKFREILGTSFIMTKGLDGCIFVYHNDDWEKFDGKFEGLPISNEDARKFTRYFYSSAQECETDDLGRVSIPQSLRKHAGLGKEVVSIGARDKVEIWDKQKWLDYNESGGFSDNEIAEKMSEFGI